MKEKRKHNHIGLFTKYYIAISATVLASLMVLGTVFSAFLLNYWKSKTFENLDAVSSGVSVSVSTEQVDTTAFEVKANRDYVTTAMRAYARINSCDILICDRENRVVNTSENSPVGAHNASFSPALSQAQKSAGHCIVRLEEYGSKVLLSYSEVTMGKAQIGTVYAIKSYRSFVPYIEDILRLFVFSALISLVISVGVAYYLVYRVYKPISQLKLATQKISEGDYSFRVEISGENEFAYLGNAFNKMATDLSALESSRRNFIANVSHELKTPMTTIGGYIDAIMDGTIDRDKQDHYLSIVSSEIKRLSRLVVAMLNLSKIEAGERKLEKKNVNLTAMLIEVMISFEQPIEKKHIEVIGLDKIGEIIANVDRDMIYQVFYNLTDNAVKFTDDGGRILVSMTSNGEKVGFRIINECSGISKEDISKIFERFYKVDRSRHVDVQGFGLGLYIAKTIVNMHGGQITARSNEGSDCEFLFWIDAQ